MTLAGAEQFPPDLGIDLLERLVSKGPYADGRVTMGFSFDQFWFPEEIVKQTFSRVIKAGVQGITSHVVGVPIFGKFLSLSISLQWTADGHQHVTNSTTHAQRIRRPIHTPIPIQV